MSPEDLETAGQRNRGRLASSVRSQQSIDLTFSYLKGNAIHRSDVAESLQESIYLQQLHISSKNALASYPKNGIL
ncbi:MAG: hypothetical protein ACI92G_001721 [Candidatus Pelagisphaera sp.]|jgi:hypothetical protein